ncbi:MAG TPA: nucleoside phosphorylase, partial [Chitinophagales bacterium]|nr:nucleoside phosphorylase [Chitinophagales bacterium]
LPEDIATTVIFVGDPARVPKVSKYFDSIEIKKTKREFVIHTGILNKKRITVLSTGMGTDNIDIVMNELDALFNVDFVNRTIKQNLTSLDIIRIGTSGAAQPDIEIDSFLASKMAIGLDGLMGFYQTEKSIQDEKILTKIQTITGNLGITACLTHAATSLLDSLAYDMKKGITLTNTGFYGPQGRSIRLAPKNVHFIDELVKLELPLNQKITNLEMETSGIYGLSTLLGHRAISLNAILANRAKGTFTKNANVVIDQLIQQTLERIAH